VLLAASEAEAAAGLTGTSVHRPKAGWASKSKFAHTTCTGDALATVPSKGVHSQLGGPVQVSLVTLDLSFISVLKVMPAVAAVMAPGAQLVVLIKPQFEAGRAQVGAGGLVKDPQASLRTALLLSALLPCQSLLQASAILLPA